MRVYPVAWTTLDDAGDTWLLIRDEDAWYTPIDELTSDNFACFTTEMEARVFLAVNPDWTHRYTNTRARGVQTWEEVNGD